MSASWLKLGIGFGIAAGLVTLVAKGASGPSNTRFVNVKKSTIRIKKLGEGVFEAAAWGEGIAFSSIPTQEPLATYTFTIGTPISAAGNPLVIAFLDRELPSVNVKGLFDQPGSERCSIPGCAV